MDANVGVESRIELFHDLCRHPRVCGQGMAKTLFESGIQRLRIECSQQWVVHFVDVELSRLRRSANEDSSEEFFAKLEQAAC